MSRTAKAPMVSPQSDGDEGASQAEPFPSAPSLISTGVGSVEARIAALELTILPHPTHNRALDALEECVARAIARVDGRPLKAKARLLYGPSGAGKTTLLEALLERYPDVATLDGDIRRVIPVEMPEQATKRALVDAVLLAMGYRARSHESANEIIKDIVDKVQRLGVMVIVIDEGHHVFSGKSLEAVSEFLKSVLNRVKCEIVIAGLPELRRLKNYDQFNRRLMPDIVLEPYDWTTVEGRLHWLGLMGRFEKILGLPTSSGLSTEDFAMRLYVASGGVVGIVSKYLSRALELATKRALEKLDLPLMAEIYASWHPIAQTPSVIDFTSRIHIPEDETVESLLAKLAKVRFDPATNPFTATPDQCAEIWARHASGDQSVRATARLIGGRRRTRASGPVGPKAF